MSLPMDDPDGVGIQRIGRLERCLSGCDYECDFEGLGLQQDEHELCEQTCNDLYGEDYDDD